MDIKKLDETIDSICIAAQDLSKSKVRTHELAELTTALAKLVEARAAMKKKLFFR